MRTSSGRVRRSLGFSSYVLNVWIAVGNLGYKFEAPQEAPPPDVDDEVRRREEEELQRVLEMSMHDKGGRGDWSQYSLANQHKSSSHPPATQPSAQASSHTPAPAEPASKYAAPPQSHPPPTYGGYVPSSNPTITADSLTTPTSTVSSVTASSPPTEGHSVCN